MSYIGNSNRDFLIDVKLGLIPGYSLVHKFGRNAAVPTVPTPIAINGVYRTPTASPANGLDIVSTSNEDNLDIDGDGAHEVTVQGLVITNGLFVAAEEVIEMEGTVPAVLTTEFVRVYRAWVSKCGLYANTGVQSAIGTITIAEVTSGDEWLVIDTYMTNGSAGQSQTALYTTPSNTTSLLLGLYWTIEAAKTVKMYFFHRPNADDVTGPYTGARRLVEQFDDALGTYPMDMKAPITKFTGATDMGFMAEVSQGTCSISADFQLLVIDNDYL